ncbi:MAG: glycosyltransferase family 2 protein [Synechococcus sp. ELA057]
MQQPLLTIAIPTYRRHYLLRRALQSAITQVTNAELEIIVVENPSASAAQPRLSETEHYCTQFKNAKLRYFRNEENFGMVGNWNRCLELARGKWITILHDDDWLSPYFAACCLAYIEQNPGIRLVGCKAFIERKGDIQHMDYQPTSIPSFIIGPNHFLFGNPFFAPGVMFDREIALSLGAFDEDWYPTMDHYLWQCFAYDFPCAFIRLPLLHYSIEDNTSMKPEVLAGYIANDFMQRSILISRLYNNSHLLLLYSRLKVYRELGFLISFFGLSIPSSVFHKAMSVTSWKPINRHWILIYFPIRLFLLAVVWLLGNRKTEPFNQNLKT